ncbi:Pls/PosA family non-ribosomal peptide synthetase, partial [Arthrobacter sp. GCM10027362]|uniref:Pls/PosA family non-ribosomal peptide synthetase n=1 Tax=Arthrobacter sp. GCM10027362 TaxID=3273379 RepID=UPI003641A91F
GANSLLMANFSAAVRKHTGLPPVAMQDIYQNPDIRRLAAVLDAAEATDGDTAREGGMAGTGMPAPHHATTFQYVACGVAQLLMLLAYAYMAAELLLVGFSWVTGARGWVETWERFVAYELALFFALGTLPILLKWILIGRWKAQEIPAWTLRYVRFWFVKTLLAASPFQTLAATPLYSVYLRALGANVGRRVTFLSPAAAVCADLFTIGDDSIVRKGVGIRCYRAHGGRIQTGPVTVGRDVFIGERTILDIHTSIGDGAQLGHSSALHRGQHVPAGQSWHGSPARPATTNYRVVEPVPCTTGRRITYSFWVVFNRLFIMIPIGFAVLAGLLSVYLDSGHLDHGRPAFYLDALLVSLFLFYGGLLLGLVAVVTVPRILNLFLTPGRVYPLYGIHYALHRTVARLTNVGVYMEITGDSSLVVHYLKILGYKQPGLVQTGSNFGPALSHDSPYLTTIGSGTMVSDGLAIMNADYSSSSFRLSPVSIGARNFFGNDIGYPAGARTGDNVLFGTKVMVPIDGPVRENTGLLGSPPFEIPRSVERDSAFEDMNSDEERKRRLPAKNRHNAVTLAIYLNITWFLVYIGLLLASAAADYFRVLGALALLAPALVFLVFATAVSILAERAAAGFRRLTPTFCSIYDIRFWRHERLWKLLGGAAYSGTPFKPVLWRLYGVRVGKKMFDDGIAIPEKTIVTIGDHATLNAGSILQCHSMEDGAFKLDGIIVGNDVTIGTGAFVHYGVRMEDGSELEADSFLMKGTEVPAGARYGGNPARQLHIPASAASAPGAQALNESAAL